MEVLTFLGSLFVLIWKWSQSSWLGASSHAGAVQLHNTVVGWGAMCIILQVGCPLWLRESNFSCFGGVVRLRLSTFLLSDHHFGMIIPVHTVSVFFPGRFMVIFLVDMQIKNLKSDDG